MAQRVLAQVPDDLVQLARIDQRLELGSGDLQLEARRVALRGRAEFLAKARAPLAEPQALGARGFAARELQHVLDDRADALGVAADDLGHAQLGRPESLGLAQQLRRVAHGADRVADLVRDAGGQPAQRRELRLLDAVRERAGVFQEDQHRRGFAAPSGAKCGSMLRTPSAAVKVPAGASPGRASALAAPHRQQVQQARRDLAQQRAGNRDRIAEHLGGRFVDQADAIARIDHQDAFAQALHDVLRELREVGEVHFLLAHQRFALAQALGQRPREAATRNTIAPMMPASG